MLVQENIHWNKTTDVIVVGFGLAGGAAAITADSHGAEVTIIEKQPEKGYVSNSSLSAGLFYNIDDVPGAIKHMEELYKVNGGLGWTEKEVIKAWAEYSAHNKEWIEALGGKVEETDIVSGYDNVPGYKSIKSYWCTGNGLYIMNMIKQKIDSTNIDLSYNTRARKILVNTNGEVIGVRGETDGQEVNIRAKKAVILTTGGFEFNENMKLNYLKSYPTYFAGAPCNTGDGIKMAQEVGASLWHMNCSVTGAVVKVDDFPIGFKIGFSGKRAPIKMTGSDLTSGQPDPCGYFLVDKDGRRFVDETLMKRRIDSFSNELAYFNSDKREYPRIPCYAIFDNKRMQSGPLTGRFGRVLRQVCGYTWSDDNQKEIEKGYIIKGDSIADLAEKLNVPPDALEKTLSKYNDFCQNQADDEFGRPANTLTALDAPPYFAVKLFPGGPNTQGGPKRNHKAQILNPDDEPIPRLYGAGECGAIFGMSYPTGGGNDADCIAFGRISGENAAKEAPVG